MESVSTSYVDNLTIQNATVDTDEGNIFLSAGDDVTANATAVVDASALTDPSGLVLVKGDVGRNNPVGDTTGVTITLDGTVSGRTVTVAGNAGNDTFRLGTGVACKILAAVPPRTVTVAGSSGTDTIVGQSTNNTFEVTSANSGVLNAKLAFSAIENLTGNTLADTFRIGDNGSLTGTIRRHPGRYGHPGLLAGDQRRHGQPRDLDSDRDRQRRRHRKRHRGSRRG